MKQKLKEIAINTGIGFTVLFLLIAILALVKLNYAFPGYDAVRSVISFGALGVASNSIGKFIKSKMK